MPCGQRRTAAPVGQPDHLARQAMADLNDPQPACNGTPASPEAGLDSAAPATSRRHRHGANGGKAHRYRRIAVLILGVAITLALAATTYDMIRRETANQAAATRQSLAAGLQAHLDRELDALRALKGLYESSEFVSEEEFRTFAAQDEHIRQRVWWARVAWAQRIPGVETPSDQGGQDFISIMTSGKFVLRYAEPDWVGGALRGLDLSAHAESLAALRQAAGSQAAAVTAPMPQDLLGRGSPTVLALVPAFASRNGAQPVALSGFVVGVFAFDGMIGAFLDRSVPDGGLAVRITDGAATIFARGAFASPVEALPLRVGDRTWRIEVATVDGQLQADIWVPLLVLLFGSALTALLYLHLLRIDGEYARISAEVRAATGELALANRELGERSAALQALADDLRNTSNEAQLANAAKTMFLANMSHELRTPLNAMIGFSEIISQQMFGDDVARYTDYARDIHASGKHLLGIIEDLLDMSRIELGKLQLHETRSSLPALVEDIVRLLRFRASEHGIRIVTENLAALPDLRLDARAMRQAFINLITNSIKFSASGTVITVAGGRASNGDVVITVADQGRGIDEAQLPHIFEAFWQGDAHRRRSNEGVGLGLAITRRLIEAHGGTITAQSRKHVGTKMIVHLPAARILSGRDGIVQAAG